MNLDAAKKRVQKYLNSNKRYPLIVDVQTKEDLANIAEYFCVGSNKFPSIEEFCNRDEVIKLDELYAAVSRNSGNTFITGLSGFLMLFGENVAKQALKTLITTSISNHVVIITYQCEKYLRFTDPRISESGRLVIVEGNPDSVCNISFISPTLSDIFTDSYSGIQKIGTAIDSCFNKDAYIATTIDKSSFAESVIHISQIKNSYEILRNRDSMLPWLQEEYGNVSQPYSFARKPKKALTEARILIAECIGAQPDEIYFTSGGTESDNWAIKGISEKGKKHHTITTQIEHHAILNACRRLEHFGFQVDYLPVDKQGVVSCEDLMKFIKGNTELISVMMVNNEIGTIEPIKALATIAHDNGILFHTDAVQAVGHIPIDVSDVGVDMLSASAHKFNGPKGIGFLYIRRGTKISSFADGGAQEFHKRAGTENIASIVGMSIALKKSCDEMEKQGSDKQTCHLRIYI